MLLLVLIVAIYWISGWAQYSLITTDSLLKLRYEATVVLYIYYILCVYVYLDLCYTILHCTILIYYSVLLMYCTCTILYILYYIYSTILYYLYYTDTTVHIDPDLWVPVSERWRCRGGKEQGAHTRTVRTIIYIWCLLHGM